MRRSTGSWHRRPFSSSASNAAGTAAEGDELVVDGPMTMTVRSNAPPTFTTTIYRDAEVIHSVPSAPELVVSAPARQRQLPGRGESLGSTAGAALDSEQSHLSARARGGGEDASADARRGDQARALRRARLRGVADRSVDGVACGVGRGDDRDGAGIAGSLCVAGRRRVRRVRRRRCRHTRWCRCRRSAGLHGTGRAPDADFGSVPRRRLSERRRALAAIGVPRHRRRGRAPSPSTTSRPSAETRTPLPPAAAVHSIVFAVERGNTRPGTSGRFWLSDVTIQQ